FGRIETLPGKPVGRHPSHDRLHGYPRHGLWPEGVVSSTCSVHFGGDLPRSRKIEKAVSLCRQKMHSLCYHGRLTGDGRTKSYPQKHAKRRTTDVVGARGFNRPPCAIKTQSIKFNYFVASICSI